MQILNKLRELPRRKKGVVVLVLLLILFVAYWLLASRGLVPPLPLPGAVATAGLASPQDAAVYLAARQFVEALVDDERERVLAMLTAGHRAKWTDASFLYDSTALQPGRSVALGDFRHSVVRYVQPPELGGETLALVTARYTVLFKNGDVVEGEVQVEENMGLQLVGDLWLIAADERKIN